jgi:hypothetical protein
MSSVLAGNARLNQVATWGPMLLFSLTPVFDIQPAQTLLILFPALTVAFHVGTGSSWG